MNNLSIILALQDGTNIAHYTSIFCPRVGEFVRFSNEEYKVLAVYHNTTSGTQFGVYVVVEDVKD